MRFTFDYVCEFCYRGGMDVPLGESSWGISTEWEMFYCNTICPTCWERLKEIPNWMNTVKGGCWAHGRDPRSGPDPEVKRRQLADIERETNAKR